MIEASLAKQYGIRIRHESNMSFSEFSCLISGLMHDTPLGQVVAIRSESDNKVIAKFDTVQKNIYLEWRRFIANRQLENPEELDKREQALFDSLKKMFSKRK